MLLDREHISWYKTCEVRLNCIESQGYYGACQYESGLKLRTYFQLFGEDFHLKWSLFRETAKCSRKPLNAVRLLQGFPGFTLRNISLKLEVSKLDMQKITKQFKEMKALLILSFHLAARLHTSSVSPELLHHFACTQSVRNLARGLRTCIYYMQAHISVNSTNLRF